MSFFENTRKPAGFGGKLMVVMMNLGHSPVAWWGLHFLELAPDDKVRDCGCGGRVSSRASTIRPSAWRKPKRSTRPPSLMVAAPFCKAAWQI